MNTAKMITEIKATCAELEQQKADLLEKVKLIDDDLTAYRMAIDALDLTRRSAPAAVTEKPADESKPERYGRKTVIEFGGRKQTITEWSKELDIGPDGIIYRLNTGWSVKDALTRTKQMGKSIQKRQPKKVYAYDAHNNVIRQYVGVGDAARDLKIPKNVVEKMLSDVSVQDQLASRNFYLAYAS